MRAYEPRPTAAAPKRRVRSRRTRECRKQPSNQCDKTDTQAQPECLLARQVLTFPARLSRRPPPASDRSQLAPRSFALIAHSASSSFLVLKQHHMHLLRSSGRDYPANETSVCILRPKARSIALTLKLNPPVESDRCRNQVRVVPGNPDNL